MLRLQCCKTTLESAVLWDMECEQMLRLVLGGQGTSHSPDPSGGWVG